MSADIMICPQQMNCLSENIVPIGKPTRGPNLYYNKFIVQHLMLQRIWSSEHFRAEYSTLVWWLCGHVGDVEGSAPLGHTGYRVGRRGYRTSINIGLWARPNEGTSIT